MVTYQQVLHCKGTNVEGVYGQWWEVSYEQLTIPCVDIVTQWFQWGYS